LLPVFRTLFCDLGETGSPNESFCLLLRVLCWGVPGATSVAVRIRDLLRSAVAVLLPPLPPDWELLLLPVLRGLFLDLGDRVMLGSGDEVEVL